MPIVETSLNQFHFRFNKVIFKPLQQRTNKHKLHWRSFSRREGKENIKQQQQLSACCYTYVVNLNWGNSWLLLNKITRKVINCQMFWPSYLISLYPMMCGIRLSCMKVYEYYNKHNCLQIFLFLSPVANIFIRHV